MDRTISTSDRKDEKESPHPSPKSSTLSVDTANYPVASNLLSDPSPDLFANQRTLTNIQSPLVHAQEGNCDYYAKFAPIDANKSEISENKVEMTLFGFPSPFTPSPLMTSFPSSSFSPQRTTAIPSLPLPPRQLAADTPNPATTTCTSTTAPTASVPPITISPSSPGPHASFARPVSMATSPATTLAGTTPAQQPSQSPVLQSPVVPPSGHAPTHSALAAISSISSPPVSHPPLPTAVAQYPPPLGEKDGDFPDVAAGKIAMRSENNDSRATSSSFFPQQTAQHLTNSAISPAFPGSASTYSHPTYPSQSASPAAIQATVPNLRDLTAQLQQQYAQQQYAQQQYAQQQHYMQQQYLQRQLQQYQLQQRVMLQQPPLQPQQQTQQAWHSHHPPGQSSYYPLQQPLTSTIYLPQHPHIQYYDNIGGIRNFIMHLPVSVGQTPAAPAPAKRKRERKKAATSPNSAPAPQDEEGKAKKARRAPAQGARGGGRGRKPKVYVYMGCEPRSLPRAGSDVASVSAAAAAAVTAAAVATAMAEARGWTGANGHNYGEATRSSELAECRDTSDQATGAKIEEEGENRDGKCSFEHAYLAGSSDTVGIEHEEKRVDSDGSSQGAGASPCGCGAAKADVVGNANDAHIDAAGADDGRPSKASDGESEDTKKTDTDENEEETEKESNKLGSEDDNVVRGRRRRVKKSLGVDYYDIGKPKTERDQEEEEKKQTESATKKGRGKGKKAAADAQRSPTLSSAVSGPQEGLDAMVLQAAAGAEGEYLVSAGLLQSRSGAETGRQGSALKPSNAVHESPQRGVLCVGDGVLCGGRAAHSRAEAEGTGGRKRGGRGGRGGGRRRRRGTKGSDDGGVGCGNCQFGRQFFLESPVLASRGSSQSPLLSRRMSGADALEAMSLTTGTSTGWELGVNSATSSGLMPRRCSSSSATGSAATSFSVLGGLSQQQGVVQGRVVAGGQAGPSGKDTSLTYNIREATFEVEETSLFARCLRDSVSASVMHKGVEKDILIGHGQQASSFECLETVLHPKITASSTKQIPLITTLNRTSALKTMRVLSGFRVPMLPTKEQYEAQLRQRRAEHQRLLDEQRVQLQIREMQARMRLQEKAGKSAYDFESKHEEKHESTAAARPRDAHSLRESLSRELELSLSPLSLAIEPSPLPLPALLLLPPLSLPPLVMASSDGSQHSANEGFDGIDCCDGLRPSAQESDPMGEGARRDIGACQSSLLGGPEEAADPTLFSSFSAQRASPCERPSADMRDVNQAIDEKEGKKLVTSTTLDLCDRVFPPRAYPRLLPFGFPTQPISLAALSAAPRPTPPTGARVSLPGTAMAMMDALRRCMSQRSVSHAPHVTSRHSTSQRQSLSSESNTTAQPAHIEVNTWTPAAMTAALLNSHWRRIVAPGAAATLANVQGRSRLALQAIAQAFAQPRQFVGEEGVYARQYQERGEHSD